MEDAGGGCNVGFCCVHLHTLMVVWGQLGHTQSALLLFLCLSTPQLPQIRHAEASVYGRLLECRPCSAVLEQHVHQQLQEHNHHICMLTNMMPSR